MPKMQNVFHVVFLKKFEGSPPTATLLLPPIVRGRTVAIPEKVVHTRPTATSWELLVHCRIKRPLKLLGSHWSSSKRPIQILSSRMSYFTKEEVVSWTPSSIASTHVEGSLPSPVHT
jgi:hypothetical protein